MLPAPNTAGLHREDLMRPFRSQLALTLAAAAFLAWLPGCAHDEKGHDQHPPKYKAHVAHEAKSFDLRKPAEHDALIEHLEKGQVEELELDKEMPSLFAFSDLGIWAIVVFLALLFILRKAAWGPMLEGLQKREESIRSAIDEAKKAREETQRVTAQFQAEMAAKMAEIPKIMEEARRDAELLKEEMRADATKPTRLTGNDSCTTSKRPATRPCRKS